MTTKEFNRIVKQLFPIIKIDNDKKWITYHIRETNTTYFCYAVWREDIAEKWQDLILKMSRDYNEDYILQIHGTINHWYDNFS